MLVGMITLGFAILICGCAANTQAEKNGPEHDGIIYRNPRVYNVDYSFEMVPDPNKIDRAKDLKVWLSIPREWDSQKAVKIISVQPEPHARYVDPEYGNPMLFWDFGKEREQPSYKVDIKFRLESYDVKVEVDPNRVGPYDKTNKEYALYTRSTHTVHITPKIRELAREAVGHETNPYLQTERIVKFVGKKMRYKRLAFERGRGIDCLLAYPVTDKETGQEYYEGSCNQYTAFMVALCRAVGIPARSVSGYTGWNPWIEPNDIKAKFRFETKLSPDGLAATQLYGKLGSHMWCEFFIPNYGWIPADAQGGTFGHQSNRMWIKWKGRDIQLGPNAPQEESEGYGVNWVALHKGRADGLNYGVLNIAKIRNSKVALSHHSDPFPANALATYPGNTLPSEGTENLRHWRQGVLSWPACYIRNLMPENLNLDQFYKDYPRTKDDRDAFICHTLRRQMGDEKFFELTDAYVDLRQKSGKAVPTSRFQELAEDISGQSLGWFFNQWVNSTDLPRLKLEKAVVRKDKEGWQIQGRLLQLGETTFRLPIELAIDTKNGREMQRLWIDGKVVDFDFHKQDEPRKLIVDPNYEVLKVQRMPPRLFWFWEAYDELVVIYGTLAEAEANKTAAERFNNDELGLGREIVKADTDATKDDLGKKCVVLFGRPETNQIAQKSKDIFPIELNKNKFTWQGVTYAQATQGVAQIAENPNDPGSLMIMYAGLSPEATQNFCDLYLYDSDSSYVIFDGDKQLAIGDWEDVDSNLYWQFKSHNSAASLSNQR